MRNIIRLSDMTERETLEILCTGNATNRAVDRFDKRLEHFSESYRANVMRGLQIDRQTWVIRDKGCRAFRVPSSLADWPECAIDDARFELARQVWRDVVHLSNGGMI